MYMHMGEEMIMNQTNIRVWYSMLLFFFSRLFDLNDRFRFESNKWKFEPDNFTCIARQSFCFDWNY
jgi:hypothetical protein